jgi:hypothetical protein
MTLNRARTLASRLESVPKFDKLTGQQWHAAAAAIRKVIRKK